MALVGACIMAGVTLTIRIIMMSNKKHLKCWLWKVMWGLGALAFILAWVSVLMRAPIGPFDPLFLLWNALVLGVLATPIKLDCHSCDVCGVKSPGMM